jgi:hypothetical protein
MGLTWKLEDHLRNTDGARSLDHLNLSTMAAVVAGQLPSPGAQGGGGGGGGGGGV